MSIERELLIKIKEDMKGLKFTPDFIDEIDRLLAQPEQEPKFNFDLERMKVAIESPISNVTVDDLVKQVKQEPVAWMQDSIELYVLEEKSAIRGYVIPLYTASKREPLSEKEIREGNQSMLNVTRESFIKGVRFAEVMHGIGEDDEN